MTTSYRDDDNSENRHTQTTTERTSEIYGQQNLVLQREDLKKKITNTVHEMKVFQTSVTQLLRNMNKFFSQEVRRTWWDQIKGDVQLGIITKKIKSFSVTRRRCKGSGSVSTTSQENKLKDNMNELPAKPQISHNKERKKN